MRKVGDTGTVVAAVLEIVVDCYGCLPGSHWLHLVAPMGAQGNYQAGDARYECPDTCYKFQADL